MSGGMIEIVATPAGEAPLWVREAWIGLRLPLAPGRSEGSWWSSGVLSSRKGIVGPLIKILLGRSERASGFRVLAQEALEALDRVRPDAAHWWREEAYHLFECPRQALIFDAPACRRMPDATVKGPWSS